MASLWDALWTDPTMILAESVFLAEGAILAGAVTCSPLLGQGEGNGGPSPLGMLPALAAIVILFYFMLIRPERRRQNQQKLLIENLKKNDRVVTVGGIYGVVTNVQRESDAVTIKVDEETNAKLRVSMAAIQRVIVDEPAGDKAKS